MNETTKTYYVNVDDISSRTLKSAIFVSYNESKGAGTPQQLPPALRLDQYEVISPVGLSLRCKSGINNIRSLMIMIQIVLK